jgi:hypothetical protein
MNGSHGLARGAVRRAHSKGTPDYMKPVGGWQAKGRSRRRYVPEKVGFASQQDVGSKHLPINWMAESNILFFCTAGIFRVASRVSGCTFFSYRRFNDQLAGD